MKKIIVFDLDDTLTKSKTRVDEEMKDLLIQLLNKYKVAIITGWEFDQINKQIVSYLCEWNPQLENLYIFPTCGAKMYQYEDGVYSKKYEEWLSQDQMDYINEVLWKMISHFELDFLESYGDVIENRGTQITYSALWSECPLEIKSQWDPDGEKRQKYRDFIKDDLKEFNVWIAGRSSIDITKNWIDKAYGIRKIMSEIWIDKQDILFIWDMLMPGGNDYPVKEFWVDCESVKNPEGTKIIINELIQ